MARAAAVAESSPPESRAMAVGWVVGVAMGVLMD